MNETPLENPFLKSFKKKFDAVFQIYKDKLMRINSIPSYEDNATKNGVLQKDYCAVLLLDFQKTFVSGLTNNITLPFNFDPTLELIQACHENRFTKEIQEEILNQCKIQFYVVLICKIDFVISQFRNIFNLPAPTNKDKANADLLKSHNPGGLLLALRDACKEGFKNIPSFNFDDLLTLNNTCQQDSRYSLFIKNILSELYQIIINDIKTPASQLGGHFSYHAIDLSVVITIISDLLEQEHISDLKKAITNISDLLKQKHDALKKAELEKKLQELKLELEAACKKEKEDKQRNEELKKSSEHSNKKNENNTKKDVIPKEINVPNINYGELYWRICTILNQHQTEQLLNHRALITQLRESQSFRSYELFKFDGQMLCRHVLQNPWLMSLFATHQMVSFINSPPFLIDQSFQLKFAGNSQEVRGARKSLISSRTIQKDNKDVRNRAPTS